MAMNTYYMLAWIDRWVPRNRARRRAAFNALLADPTSKPSAPWSANHLSTRRYSATALRRPAGRRLEVVDLRKWAGRSPVGHWAGSNADRQGRILLSRRLSRAQQVWELPGPIHYSCTGFARPWRWE
jgi:hypothetical protein